MSFKSLIPETFGTITPELRLTIPFPDILKFVLKLLKKGESEVSNVKILKKEEGRPVIIG